MSHIIPILIGFPRINTVNIMKQKQKFPEINVPASGKPKWMGGAFTVTFIFSPKGNFVVKGYMEEVEQYIASHFGQRYLVRHNLYKDKEFRTITRFSDACNLTLLEPNLSHHNYCPKYQIIPHNYDNDINSTILKLKRLPQKWIPEYDHMINRALRTRNKR